MGGRDRDCRSARVDHSRCNAAQNERGYRHHGRVRRDPAAVGPAVEFAYFRLLLARWRARGARRAALGGYDRASLRCTGRTRWCSGTASPSPVRCRAGRSRRGDGNVARMSVSLHFLREGQLPGQVSPAPAASMSRRTRRLCWRRAWNTSISSTKSFLPNRELLEALCDAAREVRHSDAH